MRQNDWDCFIRDDWRALPNLTLLAGLRYDYFSPYAEKDDRLSTLDYNSGFTRVAPVRPNEVGRVSGMKYPRTLVSPDRNNFSPHLGFAWQASRSTVVRSAYGINYTFGLYGSFTQDLAYQPPFAHVEVNLESPALPDPVSAKRWLRQLGRSWQLFHQQELPAPLYARFGISKCSGLPHDIVLNLGYSGAKGTGST